MRTPLIVTLLITLTGCITEKREPCYEPDASNRPAEPHLIYDEATNTCVRVDGFDGGVDASPDATPDAEPECSATKACTASTRPICKEASCVPCHENTFPDQACAERDETTPACNTTTGECVACTENATCTTVTASRCNTDTNACTECEDSAAGADPSCSHIEGFSYCIDGECKACESDADCPDGEDGLFVCNLLTNTCTDRVPMKREYCQTCVSQTDCLAGSCVEFDYEGAKDFYCLPGRAADCVFEGYPIPLSALEVALSDSADVCRPRSASCEAMRDVNKACSFPANEGDPETCGRSDVADDAYCVTSQDTQDRCTIRCPSTNPEEADCPNGSACIVPPGRTDLITSGVKVCQI